MDRFARLYNRRLQDQMRQDRDRQMRDAQIGAIHRASLEQQAFRHTALKAQANSAARQRLKSVLYPEPVTMPEPAIELDDEDAGRYYRTWFK